MTTTHDVIASAAKQSRRKSAARHRAGGGIGLATAEAFAKAGTSVVVADRDEETIDKAAESLRAAGHSAIGVICDVTDKAPRR
jgi:NADP-dependent 3-hydroxy acid dehydrogenase YdfG